MTVPDIIETGLWQTDPILTEAGAVKTTWLTDDVVVQVPRVGEDVRIAINSHLYETFDETDVPVPAVYHLDDEPPSYGVYERVHQDDLGVLFETIDDDTKMDLLEEAGSILGSLHQVEKEGYGVPRADEPASGRDERWDIFFSDFMNKSLERIEPIIDEETRAKIEAYMGSDQIPAYPVSSVIHDDFHPGNLLGSEDGIDAVIDFDNAIYGDRRYDVQRAKGMIGLSDPGEAYDTTAVTAFMEGYQQSGAVPGDDKIDTIYDVAARTKWADAMMYHYREGNVSRDVVECHGDSLMSYVADLV